jgi:hypothetical protein
MIEVMPICIQKRHPSSQLEHLRVWFTAVGGKALR